MLALFFSLFFLGFLVSSLPFVGDAVPVKKRKLREEERERERERVVPASSSSPSPSQSISFSQRNGTGRQALEALSGLEGKQCESLSLSLFPMRFRFVRSWCCLAQSSSCDFDAGFF